MKSSIKSYFAGYFPACDGVVKKPLPCLLAARDGAKPSIFCIFCQTDNVFVSLSRNTAQFKFNNNGERWRWQSWFIHGWIELLQACNYDVSSINTAVASNDESFISGYGRQHRSSCSQYGLLVGYVMLSVDHGVPNVNQPSHLCTQRPRPSQRKHEMMSHIPKISGNCRKINAARNFKISAFTDRSFIHLYYPHVFALQ